MVNPKTSNVILSICIAVIGWIVLELIASWIHVFFMKKSGVCPYLAAAKKG